MVILKTFKSCGNSQKVYILFELRCTISSPMKYHTKNDRDGSPENKGRV